MRIVLLFLSVLYIGDELQAQTHTSRDYAVFLYGTDFQPGFVPLPETKDEVLKVAQKQDKELTSCAYLRRSSNEEFNENVNNDLSKLKTSALQRRDDTTWEVAIELNTNKGYQKYRFDFPTGLYLTELMDATAFLENQEISSDCLVLIKGGTFTMGCTNEKQDCYDDEKPAHAVQVSDFYLGQFEVTQRLWQKIMGNNPSWFNTCSDCPVEQVSWYEVQDFLKKLNAKNPGKNYRLPTEAEWEYAAREGGKEMLFGNGNNVIDPAEINFDCQDRYQKPYFKFGIYRQKTVPVGSLRSPNALGLHDMSGNVWEWCSDWFGADYYKNSTSKDPIGAIGDSGRVLRGGSWDSNPHGCLVWNREDFAPGSRLNSVGFRLARTK